MKIYLAGERDFVTGGLGQKGQWEMMRQIVKRRLFSFYYHGHATIRGKVGDDGLTDDVRKSHEAGMELFLDSGAFTAFAKGSEIPLEEYADFVTRTRKLWFCCSSLDYIGQGEDSAIGSRKNFLKLQELGADVCPVFHVREPDKYLEQYVDEGWNYIFIGGMVPETSRWLKARLDGLWSSILADKDGRAIVRTHGFGLTDQQLMFRYPWYSVDSTSWLMTGIFGACVFPPAEGARNQGRLEKIEMSKDSPSRRKARGRHYDNLTAMEQQQVDKWLEKLGVTAEQCAQHFSYRDVVNAATFQAMESRGAKHFVREQETLFNG